MYAERHENGSAVEDDVHQGTGIVNYTKLCSVLEWLVGKWPELNSTSKAADQWASGLGQGIRCAMGHCRVVVQQPRKFEQRQSS